MRIQQLSLLAVFAEVCRQGSITRAAQVLGLSKGVVSTHLRTLETQLGARLMNRTTRRLTLTDTGTSILEVANRIVSAGEEVGSIAEAQREAPSGTLRIATTVDLGSRFVAPVIARLCAAHPELRAELLLDDRTIDPVAHRLDATLRLGVPADSSLIVQPLAEDVEIVVASPSLAKITKASQPRELASAPWVVHGGLTGSARRLFRDARGRTQQISLKNPQVTASNSDGMRALISHGVGFGLLPRHIAMDDLASGRLVRVLPAWTARSLRIYLLLPSRKHAPRRVTLFAEAVKRVFAESGLSRPS